MVVLSNAATSVADSLPVTNLPYPEHTADLLTRYAITLSVPKGSVRKGVYFDTANPHHSVRLVEGGDGRKDLLLVSGEEHDQGIKPEEYADYFGRFASVQSCIFC